MSNSEFNQQVIRRIHNPQRTLTSPLPRRAPSYDNPLNRGVIQISDSKADPGSTLVDQTVRDHMFTYAQVKALCGVFAIVDVISVVMCILVWSL